MEHHRRLRRRRRLRDAQLIDGSYRVEFLPQQADDPEDDYAPALIADTSELEAVLDDLASCFDDDLETLTPGVLNPGDSGELILDPDVE